MLFFFPIIFLLKYYSPPSPLFFYFILFFLFYSVTPPKYPSGELVTASVGRTPSLSSDPSSGSPRANHWLTVVRGCYFRALPCVAQAFWVPLSHLRFLRSSINTHPVGAIDLTVQHHHHTINPSPPPSLPHHPRLVALFVHPIVETDGRDYCCIAHRLTRWLSFPPPSNQTIHPPVAQPCWCCCCAAAAAASRPTCPSTHPPKPTLPLNLARHESR